MRELFGLIANLLPRFRHKDLTRKRHASLIVLKGFSVSFYDDKRKSGNTSFQGFLIFLRAMDTSQDGASYGTWALSLYLLWPIICMEDFRSIHPIPLSIA